MLANQTQAFLAGEPQWLAARIVLFDVQVLRGGRRILVLGTGHVVVQIVLPTAHERRYEFELGQDETRRLFGVCIENDLLTIEPPERPGIPDEGRPAITLVNATGDRRTISKWANVVDERFDAIHAALRQLESMGQLGEPMYQGVFEPNHLPAMS